MVSLAGRDRGSQHAAMTYVLVGKMDGGNIVPLPESQYEVIAGKPLADDVVEKNGVIMKVVHGGAMRKITRQYAEVAGWEMPEEQFPARRSDVYD